MRPYYDADGITIYHGDCRDVLPFVRADVLVTDPPYGINYTSSMTGHNGGTALPGIVGDADTGLRDTVLAHWGDRLPVRRPVPRWRGFCDGGCDDVGDPCGVLRV